MMGGIMDGIAQALTSSLHLQDGYFLEGSWDNYFYTRRVEQPSDHPPRIQVIIMPPNRASPGGAGEFAVAASMAAVACAYAPGHRHHADQFPINHNAPLGFTPLPTVPPIPQSPTDGLALLEKHPRWPPTRSSSTASRSPWTSTDDVRLLWVLRDILGVTRAEVRLRPGRLQGLHQPHQRQGVQPVLACRSATSSPPTRSPPSRACPPPSARTCTRCSRPG